MTQHLGVLRRHKPPLRYKVKLVDLFIQSYFKVDSGGIVNITIIKRNVE